MTTDLASLRRTVERRHLGRDLVVGPSETLRTLEHTWALAMARAEASLAAADPYDQSAWAILYGALVNGLGVDPDTFQMTYPTIAWDWATQNLGYTSPAQYDTLSTIPDWSAIGRYASTGDRFNSMYQAFLNVIAPDVSNPGLAGAHCRTV